MQAIQFTSAGTSDAVEFCKMGCMSSVCDNMNNGTYIFYSNYNICRMIIQIGLRFAHNIYTTNLLQFMDVKRRKSTSNSAVVHVPVSVTRSPSAHPLQLLNDARAVHDVEGQVHVAVSVQ